MEIWVQVHDLPHGMMTEKILQSIGNYVGVFVKSDPGNFNDAWRTYARIRIKMNIDKPLKRRMKVKREGDAWGWINFKYERLSTFCFVCGLMGHSERECAIVYANPEKTVERAFGTWLRAPPRNTRNQNIGARWPRNAADTEHGWSSERGGTSSSNTGNRAPKEMARFMELDGHISEITGDEDAIFFQQRYQGDSIQKDNAIRGDKDLLGGKNTGNITVILDAKRKRIDKDVIVDSEDIGLDMINEKVNLDGPKNELKAGPVIQARLEQ